MSGEIFPQGKYRSTMLFNDIGEDIFKKFFQNRSSDISNEEEEYLIELLDRRISRWFVPHFLREVNDFSEGLMVALLETGIKIIDPSYNNNFVNSTQRVYKSEVSDYLTDRFPRSNLDEKRGIFRLFYWVPVENGSKQHEKRLSMLLEEYAKTRSKKLKKYISYNLPEEINEYPDILKEKAEVYLKDIKE